MEQAFYANDFSDQLNRQNFAKIPVTLGPNVKPR